MYTLDQEVIVSFVFWKQSFCLLHKHKTSMHVGFISVCNMRSSCSVSVFIMMFIHSSQKLLSFMSFLWGTDWIEFSVLFAFWISICTFINSHLVTVVVVVLLVLAKSYNKFKHSSTQQKRNVLILVWMLFDCNNRLPIYFVLTFIFILIT